MRKLKVVIGLLLSVLLTVALVVPVMAAVDPAEVKLEMDPGESIEIEKTVDVPEYPSDVVYIEVQALPWPIPHPERKLIITLEPSVISVPVPGNTQVTFVETIAVTDDATQCSTLEGGVRFLAYLEYSDGRVEYKGLGNQDISVKVRDVTGPKVGCVEGVNPHGEKIPPAGSSTPPGPKGGRNDDGFYQLLARDNCDDPDEIQIYVVYRFSDALGDGIAFGPYTSGDVVKITEAPGAAPSAKKMGSSNGQAGAVVAHIKVPKDSAPTPEDPTGLVLVAIDTSGNWNVCRDCCFVPPPPK
ncbi:hypothetical protein ACFLWX_03355 [Chloroflexota bacterium]